MSARRRLTTAVCLAAVGLTIAGSAIAGSTARTTIRFIEVGGGPNDRFVDYANNNRPDPGDVFMGTSALYRWDGIRRGARIGRAEIMCTIVSMSGAQCTGTFFFPAGKIVAVGFVRFGSGPAKVPVAGGTGRYVGARGVFTSRTIGTDNDVSADTITLLP